MDGSRFDTFTRAMATSRRGALKLLLGAAAAGVASAVAHESTGVTAVAADEADGARRNPFFRMGQSCANGEKCGRLAPCTDGICQPTKCLIDGVIREVGFNPDNDCQYCRPTADPSTWTAWRFRPFGTMCSPITDVGGDAACLADVHAHCTSDGQCGVAIPEPDGTPCGHGQTCCGTYCCAADECCNPDSGICEACGPHCTIDGVFYPDGTVNRETCDVCKAAAEPFFWSTADDNTACGPNLDRVCCNGDCLPAGECCPGSGNREDGACAGGCTIDGVDYSIGQSKPDDWCKWCEPATSTTSWSPVPPNRACDATGLTTCCNGECCPQHTTCMESDGVLFCGA